jgi:hypothetical protein
MTSDLAKITPEKWRGRARMGASPATVKRKEVIMDML